MQAERRQGQKRDTDSASNMSRSPAIYNLASPGNECGFYVDSNRRSQRALSREAKWPVHCYRELETGCYSIGTRGTRMLMAEVERVTESVFKHLVKPTGTTLILTKKLRSHCSQQLEAITENTVLRKIPRLKQEFWERYPD